MAHFPPAAPAVNRRWVSLQASEPGGWGPTSGELSSVKKCWSREFILQPLSHQHKTVLFASCFAVSKVHISTTSGSIGHDSHCVHCWRGGLSTNEWHTSVCWKKKINKTHSNGIKPLVTLDNNTRIVYLYGQWLNGFSIEVYCVQRFFWVSLTSPFVSWRAGAVSNSIMCKVFGWQTIKHAVGEWDLGCIRLMWFYGAAGWAAAHCSPGFDKSNSLITTWEWQPCMRLGK